MVVAPLCHFGRNWPGIDQHHFYIVMPELLQAHASVTQICLKRKQITIALQLRGDGWGHAPKILVARMFKSCDCHCVVPHSN